MKVFAIHKPRSCATCSKCCEGYLEAEIYGFSMSLSAGACKFLSHDGCSIYSVRPKLCKDFLCGWKQNSSIPDNMRPDLSHVIILQRKINDYRYLRMFKCGDDVKDYVFDWAEESSKKGLHIVGTDNQTNIRIFSEDEKFKELFKT